MNVALPECEKDGIYWNWRRAAVRLYRRSVKNGAEKCKYVLVFINHELGTSSVFLGCKKHKSWLTNRIQEKSRRRLNNLKTRRTLTKKFGNAKIGKFSGRISVLRNGLLLVDGGSGRSVGGGRHVVEALHGSRARCRHLCLQAEEEIPKVSLGGKVSRRG